MEPDRQPVLTGERVAIRPMTAADWQPQFAVASDRELWAIHPAHDRWQEPVFRAFFDASLRSGGGLTILDAGSGAVIGGTRYGEWDRARGRIEIGWTFLARSHWGGTYNAELKRLMLDHIHRWVPTVTFVVGEGNLRSRRALEKIGAVLLPESEVRRMAGRDVVHLTYAHHA